MLRVNWKVLSLLLTLAERMLEGRSLSPRLLCEGGERREELPLYLSPTVVRDGKTNAEDLHRLILESLRQVNCSSPQIRRTRSKETTQLLPRSIAAARTILIVKREVRVRKEAPVKI